ncbi:LytR family transcriptional regulator [Solihabitans fulvus]|uniref:LytR family transcriptional regulator n=1 Tax=Solihabitans fulvus TaxID=1892852 RepID=A0A5B2WT80_9PSEU|nr:LytR family transcriptional regulator [Solihabitans fulvus]
MGPASVTGSSGQSRYRRRRPLPALVVFLILGVVAVFVWVKVLDKANNVDEAIKCNTPGSAPASAAPSGTPAAPGTPQPKLGQALGHTALDKTDPAAPVDVHFRVLNASTQRNAATFAATTLTELGFQQAANPDNDPIYTAADLGCRGQIRFGPNGAAAARTLSLVEPCTELISDDRQDATVDLAVGKKFDEVKASTNARQVLEQLSSQAAKQPNQQGGQLADASSHPSVAPSLLQAAHDVHC